MLAGITTLRDRLLRRPNLPELDFTHLAASVRDAALVQPEDRRFNTLPSENGHCEAE